MNYMKEIVQIDNLMAKKGMPKAKNTWRYICAYRQDYDRFVYSYEIDYCGKEKVAARLIKEKHSIISYQKELVSSVEVPVDFDFETWRCYVENNYNNRGFRWLKGV